MNSPNIKEKPLIIYDLEGTLGQVYPDEDTGTADLLLRPGLVEALQEQGEFANIALATRASLRYVTPFLDLLAERGFEFGKVCTQKEVERGDRSRSFPFKDLSAIYAWGKTSIENTLVVEDTQLYPREIDNVSRGLGDYSQLVVSNGGFDITHRVYGNPLPDRSRSSPAVLLVGALGMAASERRVTSMARLNEVIRRCYDINPHAIGTAYGSVDGLGVHSFEVSNRYLVRAPDRLLLDMETSRRYMMVMPDAEKDVPHAERATVKVLEM
jgi:hypothetical protein